MIFSRNDGLAALGMVLAVASVKVSAQIQQGNDAEACVLGSSNLRIDMVACSNAIAMAQANGLADHSLAALHAARARASLYLGYIESADEDAKKAIALNPASAEAYNFSGLIQHTIGNYQKAVKDYRQALAINPFYATVYRNLATTYFFQRWYDDALTEYNKALEKSRFDPEGYVFRGLVHYIRADYAAAAADFAQVDDLAYAYDYNPFWRFLSQKQSGEDGRDNLLYAMAAYNDDVWPFPLFQVYLGKLDETILFEQVKNNKQRLAESYFYFGLLLLSQGEFEEGKIMLQTAVSDLSLNSAEQLVAQEMLRDSP